MCMVKIEQKACSSFGWTVWIVFQVTTLFYSQTIYFNAQNPPVADGTVLDETTLCKNRTPQIYFWLMLNILVFYCFFMVSICYFFRTYCQDKRMLQKQKEKEVLELANDQMLQQQVLYQQMPDMEANPLLA